MSSETCIQRLATAQDAHGALQGKGRHPVLPSPIAVFLEDPLSDYAVGVVLLVIQLLMIMIVIKMTMGTKIVLMLIPKLQTSDFEV